MDKMKKWLAEGKKHLLDVEHGGFYVMLFLALLAVRFVAFSGVIDPMMAQARMKEQIDKYGAVEVPDSARAIPPHYLLNPANDRKKEK